MIRTQFSLRAFLRTLASAIVMMFLSLICHWLSQSLRESFFSWRYTGININREVLFYLVNRSKCTFALILSSLYNTKPDYQNLICLFVKT